MHRFFLPGTDQHSTQFTMGDGDELHHLRVVRARPGDVIELVNGRGLLAQARIVSVDRHRVCGEVLAVACHDRDCRRPVRLVCALPRRSAFDDIIEKCTELGVSEVIPVITARTEAAPSSEAALRMQARFQQIVISASKQSRRLWFPEVCSVMPFVMAVDRAVKEGGALFIPWLEGERIALADGLKRVDPLSPVTFFIGPEGDFTPEEAGYAVSKGALPVSLGTTVLRVATAAIAVTALVRLESYGSRM
jgi:16S rRNA (uracil1498-N3)-methyltransferase